MPVRVPEAATALGVHPATLRRWLRAGAPQARRGRRGRGGGALVDLAALRAWRVGRREPCEAGVARADLVILAGELPEMMATAVHDAWRNTSGPWKRELAGVMAGAWFEATSALLDRLRADCPAVPELQAIPERIEYLRAFK
ncbi:MAG: hypothetical protein ACSLE2_12835 [Lysobacterales bacterium]